MTEWKAYQALASQVEQAVDILVEIDSGMRTRHQELMQKLNEHPRSNGHDETFLTTNQAKTLWSFAKKAGPWAFGIGATLLHLCSHLLHH